MSDQLGQPVIIENRTGGTDNIAAQAAINSPADGYTLLLAAASNAINASFYARLPFNFLRDIAPVAGLVSWPVVMVVNPSVPAKTVPEFIGYAKANPGRINMASGGIGGTNHLAGELFKMMTGVNMVHVPYRGGEAPALTDMIGGQVHVMFVSGPESIEHIKSGKLRALAVSSATRWEKLPDIPTIGENVPGYEVNSWLGIGAPRATPPEVVEKLSREINAGLANQPIRARFAEVGATPMIVGPVDFGKLIADETDKWSKVIRAAHIKREAQHPRAKISRAVPLCWAPVASTRRAGPWGYAACVRENSALAAALPYR